MPRFPPRGPRGRSFPRQAWSWSPGTSSREFFRGDGRISQVPGEPRLSICHVLRLRQDRWSQTLRDRGMAPSRGTVEAPARNRLSKLDRMAFGLAVYASQRRLPGRHARLASSCRSGSPGRAFHPQGSAERFPKCNPYIPSSFPKLAWRKPLLCSCAFRDGVAVVVQGPTMFVAWIALLHACIHFNAESPGELTSWRRLE